MKITTEFKILRLRKHQKIIKNIIKKHKSYRGKYHHYVASEKGKVFHKPNWKSTKRTKNKTYFKTKREAINKGLRPWKRYKP